MKLAHLCLYGCGNELLGRNRLQRALFVQLGGLGNQTTIEFPNQERVALFGNSRWLCLALEIRHILRRG